MGGNRTPRPSAVDTHLELRIRGQGRASSCRLSTAIPSGPAVGDTSDFPVEPKRLSRGDAYMLTSVAGDVDITQLVDGNVGVHVICPKDIFVK